MPLFMPDDDLARLSADAASVAEKADDYIRKLHGELESVKAKSDAAAITAEQTCSLLEQKYLCLSQEFSNLESRNAQLQSSLDDRLAELAQAQALKHQLHLQAIGKDGEIERLTMEISELHKSKRQLIELLEQKDSEISEKNSTIQSYLDKIVKLTDSCTEKEARLAEAEAELARSQATCTRLSQEKELIERHNKWLNEEFAAKVDSFTELRRKYADLEAEMSAKLADAERTHNENSRSLNWHKNRLRELESKVASLQEELCSGKDAAAATEEQYSAELFTANKLVDLYKESSEEWSRKAGELEGVIKALEAHLSQVENDYKERLEKEVSMRKHLEKETEDLKLKLEKCEAEIEKSRKADELHLLPLSSFTKERWVDSDNRDKVEESRMVVPKIPSGVSGTALAASLLRDGWSLATMYERYQEAVDALRHEQLGRKEAEAILQRVLCELEDKAGVVQDERAEYERMVDAYSLVNQKLQDSMSEQSNLEKIILELKANLRRSERENSLAQKDISDLQKQVIVLLKECQDIQLRCGVVRDEDREDSMLVADVEMNVESDTDKIISEHVLTFKDINGLVEQNVKLRNLVRSLSDQIENREMELKESFDLEIKKRTDEAASKVAAVLERAEEQGRMIESLHTSVAMYKRLYEEEHKLHSSYSHPADAPPSENGRKDLFHLLEDSQDATRKAQEKSSERVRCLEEDLAKARSEIIALRFERDKLAMESNFAKEKLEDIMKDAERQREETKGVLARNVEFSQLIIDYQRKVRESSETLNAAEELSRKLSMEVSVLKHEKEMLSNAEKRACDEVRGLSERVHRLQASLDTIQSAEEVREEARAAERKKQEDYIKQIEREWVEAKKELQEERNNVRNLTTDRDQTLKNAMKQVEEMGKELAGALQAVSSAESRAAVAEARLSDLEKKIKHSDFKALELHNSSGSSSLSSNEIVVELRIAKEEMGKLKEEAEANKNHMLQYKSIAQVNESALKQMESAHENYKLEAEKRQKSLEEELLSLRERVSELENECIRKSEEVASAAQGKEETLSSALAEIARLKEESIVKSSQIAALEIQISALKNDLEREHERWRVAQGNYERQVILQSETIQELTKTSQALALLQEEASELRKLADARETENSDFKAKWEIEKSMLEEQKNLAEKKYDELNEQNKILHSRLEALHIRLAEKDRGSTGLSSSGSSDNSLGDSGLQNVVNYLRRSKEIAETEISLLKQEKLRLQSQLENALKTAEAAQASLNAERANSRASLLTEEQIKSLQLQVREMNLLRESNMQLREENKHNFEECQKLREVAQKERMDSENLENQLKERQIELDSCKKEIEMLRMEKDLEDKRVNELLEKFKNVDAADYDRLKDNVRQMEEKMKKRDAQIEDIKKLLSDKQERISQLEQELANSKQELNEREQRLNDAQQVQASMKSENDRQKRILAQFKRRIDALSKEKEEMYKENQALSKQLEEMKQSKKSTGDTMGEQVMKEKEEKEHRIQILEKTVEKLRDELRRREDEMKKKEDDFSKEKAMRLSAEKTFEDSVRRVAEAKTKVENDLQKLDKYQSAVTRLSEELDKLKQAEGDLPEGTSVVQILARSILDDRAAAFTSAVEYFERVAHSVAADIRSSTRTADSVTDSLVAFSTSVAPTPAISASPVTPSVAPAPTTTNQPTKPLEDKEKRQVMHHPNTELRKTGVRRLVRPRLVKHEEPQGDVEMSEAEGATTVGKQTSSHCTEIQGNNVAVQAQSPLRKRLATSSAPELHQESVVQGETSSDIALPLTKKPKGSDSQPESAEGQSAAAQAENVILQPPVDESLDATADLPQGSTEEAIDADKEETDAAEEKTEEPMESPQENEDELQGDANDAIEENLEKAAETEATLNEEGSRDQTDQDNQELSVDMDSEREEGELLPDVAAETEEIGEVQHEPVATPTGSPGRIDTTQMEEGEATPEALTDEKNDVGDGAEEVAAAEGSDKSPDDNEQNVVGSEPLPETTTTTTTTTKGGGEEPISTIVTAAEPDVSKQASSSRVTAEPEEAKQASSTLSNASTIVNLSERARERARERQLGAGARTLTPPAARGRARGVRGRVGVRGGRSGRGGRGQPSGQQ